MILYCIEDHLFFLNRLELKQSTVDELFLMCINLRTFGRTPSIFLGPVLPRRGTRQTDARRPPQPATNCVTRRRRQQQRQRQQHHLPQQQRHRRLHLGHLLQPKGRLRGRHRGQKGVETGNAERTAEDGPSLRFWIRLSFGRCRERGTGGRSRFDRLAQYVN